MICVGVRPGQILRMGTTSFHDLDNGAAAAILYDDGKYDNDENMIMRIMMQIKMIMCMGSNGCAKLDPGDSALS